MEKKMECRNCGSLILEGDKFCSKCGTRVAEEAGVGQAETEAAKAEEADAGQAETEAAKAEEADAGQAETEAAKAEEAGAGQAETVTLNTAEKPIPLCIPEEKSSKSPGSRKNMFKGFFKRAGEPGRPKKRGLKVVLGILAVAVVALLANSAKLINSYHRNFSTPEEYYRWVERRTIQKNAKTFAEYYANYFMEYLRGYDSRTSGTIRLELGSAGRKVMESAGLPWFEEGSFAYEATRKDGVMQSILGMEIGGEELFGMDVVMDLQDEAVYLGFPGLTEKYLALDTGDRNFIRGFESVFDMEPEEYLDALELLEAFYKECPDKKQVEALANRYLDLLLDSIDDVKMRTGKTARAGGVTQSCTTLEIYLDKEDIRNMLSDFLKELREDSEIEDLLCQVFELAEELDLDAGYYRDSEEFYEAFQENIDEILDDMEYYITYHNELDMTVYVDDKGRIIGRTMEFPNSWDEVSVSYLFPRHGSRFGYKASVMVDGEEVAVTGSGKEFGNKIDGSFTLKYDGNGIVDIEVEDFDLKSLNKGYLNGCFTVTASSAIRRNGNMGFLYTYLSDMQLILDVSMDSSSEKLGIELREGKELWGALTVTAKSGSGKKISVPSTKKAIFVDDDRDFADWWDTIEWDSLIKKMDKAGMSSETIEQVEEFSEMDAEEFMDELLELIWYWLDM